MSCEGSGSWLWLDALGSVLGLCPSGTSDVLCARLLSDSCFPLLVVS
jgi:hypothetical protein